MATKCDHALEYAVEHQLLANVLVCAFGNRYELPCMLVAHTELPDPPGFYAALQGGRGSLVDDLVKKCVPVEVCFRTPEARVYFDTLVLKKKKNFWINRQVLLKYPTTVQPIEQRSSDREYVPDHIRVLARLSREGATDWCPVLDVGDGGASLVYPAARPFLQIEPGAMCQVQFSLDGGSAVGVTAQHRYTQQLSSNSVRLGLQFRVDAMSPEAVKAFRQLLAEIGRVRLTRSFRHTLRKFFK